MGQAAGPPGLVAPAARGPSDERRRQLWAGRGACAWLVATISAEAAAHGFGQRYDLPLSLFLGVAGITVAVSLEPSRFCRFCR